MNLYQRILGSPFVFNHVRPLVSGGIDWSPFYARVEATDSDVLLDVGCGTGAALQHLKSFARYEGIDTDQVAIEFARKNFGQQRGVSFKCQICTVDDVTNIQPSRVLLFGLLHHISDEQALELLSALKASTALRRIVTVDIVYLKRHPVSNLLASLDRGKFCRTKPEYEALVSRAGLKLAASDVIRCHPTRGLAKYLTMTLEP